MAIVLDGRQVAKNLQQRLIQQHDLKRLCLGIILVSHHAASVQYVNRKRRLAEQLGIKVQLRHVEATITTEEIIGLIDQWNNDDEVNGILVQLPLPQHIDQNAIVDRLCPYKDVDGLSPWSLGQLVRGQPMLVSATARGVVELLSSYDIAIAGQRVVVVGRSSLVGKPISLLMQSRNATVTVTHRQTPDLVAITSQADILISAAGQPGLITQQHVKPGAVVIDVGLTSTDNGLQGDVRFDQVQEMASAVSPVPGGVGPLTVTCLMQNLVQAEQLMHQSNGDDLPGQQRWIHAHLER